MVADCVRYNEQRPHEALGSLTPRPYLMESTQPSTSDLPDGRGDTN